MAAAFVGLAFLAGGALLGARAVARLTGLLQQNVHLVAYLRDDMAPDRAEALAGLLRRIPGVAAINAVSSEQALGRLRTAAASHSAASATLQAIEPEFLPRSLEIALVPGADLPARAGALARRLRGIDGVAEVDAMADGLGRLATWIRLGRGIWWVALALGVCAGIATLAIAVRGGRGERRRAAEVLWLLGETPAGIRLPGGLVVTTAAAVGTAIGMLALWLCFSPAYRALALALGLSPGEAPPFLQGAEIGAYAAAALAVGLATGLAATPVPHVRHG